MNDMNDKELVKITIEEFERLQNYMMAADKASPAYQLMKDRYSVLKVMLTSFGINIVSLDKINE